MSKLATRKRTVKRSANRRTKHNSMRLSNLRRKVSGSKKRVRKSTKVGGGNGDVNEIINKKKNEKNENILKDMTTDEIYKKVYLMLGEIRKRLSNKPEPEQEPEP